MQWLFGTRVTQTFGILDLVATPLHVNDPKKNNSDKILPRDENYKKSSV